ncbi:threonine ammonia-lyase IlvA [Mobilicoccus pelagius]|uniref:L-threonine dehydratase n=1 Tax=Mobilicoccus pelagius NBRC 104925 TaxID=1089455 RepID=H5UML0_9MICO|nr:threonine ammonia-lyase IlvA [Mobilicoccus pelagius]GAB46968.1 threonine dehydratase [Mobilicoccus pelagius NBRC 104925]
MTRTDPLPTALDVEAAFVRLRSVIRETPLIPSVRLSAATGANVWVKREDLQPVRSYKVRGAYNLIAQLDAEERAKGVVTASAGNHAQGFAFACAQLGLHGRVYVPSTTPRQKRDRITALGAGHVDLVVDGETYDDAAAAARADCEHTGAVMVPAFDHADTIAGQGTTAIEIVEQLGHAPDVLVVPVGGAGMLAGCTTWLAARHPRTRVVGAEPTGAPCLAAAIEAGEPVTLDHIETFVDGAAVRRAGDLTHAIVDRHDVDLVTVDEGRICTEMLDLYQVDGIIAEPAGALASAALLSQLEVEPGQDVVVLLSGGNNDVSRYAEIVERSLVDLGRKHYFLVTFPQEPGALRRFVEDVLGPDDDIALFEYVKRSNREAGPALVGIELAHREDLDGLLQRMDASPMTIERIPADSPFYRFLV